jgi:hypothetical protein
MDNRWQSQAGQLAGIPGRKATQEEGVMYKLPEPVYFLPGLKDDRGESKAGQLAGVPGRKATHVEGRIGGEIAQVELLTPAHPCHHRTVQTQAGQPAQQAQHYLEELKNIFYSFERAIMCCPILYIWDMSGFEPIEMP